MSNESKESPSVDPSLLVEVGNTKIPMSELIMALDLLKGVSGRNGAPRLHRPSPKDAVRMWNQFVQDLVEPREGAAEAEVARSDAQVELAASILRCDQLARELAELNENFAKLTQLHTDERANSEALATALGVARGAVETQRVELSALQLEFERAMAAAVEKASADAQTVLTKEKESFDLELGKVIAERDGLGCTLAEVAVQAETSRSQLEQVRASWQACEARIEALTTAAAQSEANHQEAWADLVAMHEAAFAASGEAHAGALARQAEAHAAEIAQLIADKAELSAGSAQLARTLAAALGAQEEAARGIEQLRPQLAEQESMRHEVCASLKALEALHLATQTEREALGERVLELEAQLAESSNVPAEHVERSDEPCVSCASLEGQVDSLQLAIRRAADVNASLVQHAAKLHVEKRQLAEAIGGEDPLETLRTERANAANVVAYAASLHAELCYESSVPTQTPPPASPAIEHPTTIELPPSPAEPAASERGALASTRPHPRSEAPTFN